MRLPFLVFLFYRLAVSRRPPLVRQAAIPPRPPQPTDTSAVRLTLTILRLDIHLLLGRPRHFLRDHLTYLIISIDTRANISGLATSSPASRVATLTTLVLTGEVFTRLGTRRGPF